METSKCQIWSLTEDECLLNLVTGQEGRLITRDLVFDSKKRLLHTACENLSKYSLVQYTVGENLSKCSLVLHIVSENLPKCSLVFHIANEDLLQCSLVLHTVNAKFSKMLSGTTYCY